MKTLRYIILGTVILITEWLCYHSANEYLSFKREQIKFLKELVTAQDELIIEADCLLKENNITSKDYDYFYNKVDSIWYTQL